MEEGDFEECWRECLRSAGESIFEVTEGEFDEYQKESLWSARVTVQRVAKGVYKVFLGVFEEC